MGKFFISIEQSKELLINHVPKVIKPEAENEQALGIVEELIHRERTPEKMNDPNF